MMEITTRQSRLCAALLAALLSVTSQSATADDRAESLRESNPESPARGIQRDHVPLQQSRQREDGYRTIDGSGNHTVEPSMNASHTMLMRRMPNDYADYSSQMSGQGRPSAREISNAVAAQDEPVFNRRRRSDYLWQWGQFLDHDIDLTDGASPAEPAPIPIPAGDPHFDPHSTGAQTMSFNRSAYEVSTGTGADNPRQQVNEITGWIDASNVYGSDEVRAAALRTNDGTGRLKTSDGDLLPFNTDGHANAGGSSPELFLAGDVRANEQVGLTAMHTLFVREHNRLADDIRNRYPALSGEEIYQQARRIVGAQMQVITYEEFLPALLGRNALSRYRGYDPSVDARVMNSFSTGAYRLGHSLLNSTIMRVDRRGREIEAGHLPLRNAFFAPQELIDHGIEPILRGLAMQRSQELDNLVVDDVRNFLFGAPGHGGFDLASLNIQRGRDHGLPSYNDAREMYGLPRAASFADISSSPETQAKLSSVYTSPDEVDMWVGGLAEDHRRGAMVGDLFFAILKEQFEALRDGDRYWYLRTLNLRELSEVNGIRLSEIIRRNTEIGRELRRNVFRAR